jgi:hypothetical protein
MSRNKPSDSKDEITIKEIDAWKLSFSKSERCLCINTTSYHPFTLKLSRNDLRELIDSIDKLIKQVG